MSAGATKGSTETSKAKLGLCHKAELKVQIQDFFQCKERTTGNREHEW